MQKKLPQKPKLSRLLSSKLVYGFQRLRDFVVLDENCKRITVKIQ